MTTIYLTVLLSMGAPAFALPSEWKINCAKQISAESGDLGAPWMRVVDPAPNVFAYRAPTKAFGTWKEIQFSAKPAFARLATYSESGVKTKHWDENCKPKSSTGKWLPRNHGEPSAELFTDSKLAETLKKQKAGIIYIWAPGMVYSAKFYGDFQSVAIEKGLKFVSLIAPETNSALARTVAAQNSFQYDSKRVTSIELLMRSSNAHYPKTFVFKDGKIAFRPIMGVMPKEELGKRIDEEMAVIK